jgi:hypothetical protein
VLHRSSAVPQDFSGSNPSGFLTKKEKGKLAKIKRNDNELTRLLVKIQPNALGMVQTGK